jgi:hypothetical protein
MEIMFFVHAVKDIKPVFEMRWFKPNWTDIQSPKEHSLYHNILKKLQTVFMNITHIVVSLYLIAAASYILLCCVYIYIQCVYM